MISHGGIDTLKPAFLVPANFSIDEVVDPAVVKAQAATPFPPPFPLGTLLAFTGTFTGHGLNTIFRPDSAKTPTPMPVLPNTTDPPDNVLELNLTDETLSFQDNLVSIPNRGSNQQADKFLNGVPYTQSISDVTFGKSTGIHFEPGIWLVVPATDNPKEPITVARMASVPHGVTIIAQGVALPPTAGKPNIPKVDITPLLKGSPANPITFQNQTAANRTTRRIPQDLTTFIASGKITQAIINDPNTLLHTQIQNQTITQTIQIEISTHPGKPLSGGPLTAGTPAAPNFGGGVSNIAFLPAQANPQPGGANSNANTVQMDAIFWIETVVYEIDVPPMPEGTPPVTLNPVQKGKVPLVPSFVAAIPFVPGKGFKGGIVKVSTTQIQYSQKVMLDFAALSWPHVSVASLVPAAPIPIPESLLPLT